jgi:prophage tail gpP-like protein
LEGLQRKGLIIGFRTQQRRSPDDGGTELCHTWMTKTGLAKWLAKQGIQIQVRSLSQDPVDSSIEIEKHNGGRYENQSLLAIGNDVLKDFGMSIVAGPGSSGRANEPFKLVQINYGETPYHLISRLGMMRNLTLAEKIDGVMSLVMTPEQGSAALIEGKNIISARITIKDPAEHSVYLGVGQDSGTDQERYQAVSERRAQTPGHATRYRPHAFTAERPVTQSDLQHRVDFEMHIRSIDLIDADISVYGWLTNGNSGELWREGISVYVKTAMGMLDTTLFVQAVTYTQDSENGTMTMLTCSNQPGRGLPLGGSSDRSDEPPIPSAQAIPPTDPLKP